MIQIICLFKTKLPGHGNFAYLGCGVAQIGCCVAQIGCGVAQIGGGVAQIGGGVAQTRVRRSSDYGAA
jgi:hypothetical protein